MAFNKSERPDSPMRRRGGRRRKKVCVFCASENNVIDYKDTNTGNCAKHQRALTVAIKRARHVALMPYTVE